MIARVITSDETKILYQTTDLGLLCLGDKFVATFKFLEKDKDPSQQHVEDVIDAILSANTVRARKVETNTSRITAGGWKIRIDGPKSPGLSLDSSRNFAGFDN